MTMPQPPSLWEVVWRIAVIVAILIVANALKLVSVRVEQIHNTLEGWQVRAGGAYHTAPTHQDRHEDGAQRM